MSDKIEVVLDIPLMTTAEWERQREMFERVSLPTLIHRLAAAVEKPQTIRSFIESRMEEG